MRGSGSFPTRPVPGRARTRSRAGPVTRCPPSSRCWPPTPRPPMTATSASGRGSPAPTPHRKTAPGTSVTPDPGIPSRGVAPRTRRRIVPERPAEAPQVVVPHRAYWLFRGPLSEVGAGDTAAGWPDGTRLDAAEPAFVWPADRAWCVAKDVDPHWAGIGGPGALVAELHRGPPPRRGRRRPDPGPARLPMNGTRPGGGNAERRRSRGRPGGRCPDGGSPGSGRAGGDGPRVECADVRHHLDPLLPRGRPGPRSVGGRATPGGAGHRGAEPRPASTPTSTGVPSRSAYPPQEPAEFGFCLSVRRETLDPLVAARVAALPGVTWLNRRRVVGLLGAGGVRGVVDSAGAEHHAPVVVGADGWSLHRGAAGGARKELEHPAVRLLIYRYVAGYAAAGHEPGPDFSLRGNEMAYAFPSDRAITCLAADGADRRLRPGPRGSGGVLRLAPGRAPRDLAPVRRDHGPRPDRRRAAQRRLRAGGGRTGLGAGRRCGDAPGPVERRRDGHRGPPGAGARGCPGGRNLRLAHPLRGRAGPR